LCRLFCVISQIEEMSWFKKKVAKVVPKKIQRQAQDHVEKEVNRVTHEKCREAFDEYAGEEGVLNLPKFEKAVKKMGLPSAGMTDKFRSLDKDGNEQLTFVEFVKILIR